ncbi:hypothetical protein A2U01_0074816, partial [Trifolium medium]|nr:hypothetical protein [Trifolium medium]
GGGEVEREGGGFETEEDLIGGRKEEEEDLKRFDEVESFDWCLRKLLVGEGVERVEEAMVVELVSN